MCHETVVGGKPMETAAVIDTATGKTLWQTPYSSLGNTPTSTARARARHR